MLKRVIFNLRPTSSIQARYFATTPLFRQEENKSTFSVRGSISRAIICGYLGNEPMFRSKGNSEEPSKEFATLNVATSEYTLNKDKERVVHTTWHKVVVFNDKVVELLRKFGKKGTLVYLEGSLSDRTYTTKDGQERTITQIVVSNASDFKILRGEYDKNEQK
jgi:single stranded DNA-binding protein